MFNESRPTLLSMRERGKTVKPPVELKEHVAESASVFLGLALGDSLGWPTEFMPLRKIYQKFGRQGITEPPHPALITDDTQMTIAVSRALATSADAGIDDLMKSVVRNFIEWAESPENNRAPGATCMAGVKNLKSGVNWRDAGIADRAGCGAAMRVAMVGYLYSDDVPKLVEVAEATAVATHRHPEAVASAIAAAYMVKLGLDGYRPLEMIEPTVSLLGQRGPQTRDLLRQVHEVVAWNDEHAALASLGEGWLGHEAVALALYCCARYPNSWTDCVRRGANTSGDSDSIACIAGGIQAARLGLERIPTEWAQRLERREEVLRLAVSLAQAKMHRGQAISPR